MARRVLVLERFEFLGGFFAQAFTVRGAPFLTLLLTVHTEGQHCYSSLYLMAEPAPWGRRTLCTLLFS